MIFMTKSNHRRQDMIQRISATLNKDGNEIEQPLSGHRKPQHAVSTGVHALMATGTIIIVLALLIAPMLYWLI